MSELTCDVCLLNRLGGMGCVWGDLGEGERGILRDLMKALLNSPRINAIALSSFAMGCGKMGYGWHEDVELRELFYQGMSIVLAKEEGQNRTDLSWTIANVMNGMGQIGERWCDVPSEMKSLLFRHIPRVIEQQDAYMCQQISNIISG